MANASLLTGGRYGSPKLDLGGCVLYAPLWRPDMVARGGRIVNGSGICTGSPLHLAVGANTVDVTQAGTLTVYMPEGGTVASGTMTVTGSPVTVSAGIATTITTTGATGNITVTSSNIIRSKDKSNLAMTVTGATWGYQGRSFDGNDDYIAITDPNSVLNFTSSDFSIWAWVKCTDTTPFHWNMVLGRGLLDADGYYFGISSSDCLQFTTSQAAASQNSFSATGAWFSAYGSKWVFIGVNRAGASARVFTDNVDITNTAASHINPLTSAKTARIGIFDDFTLDYEGFIGEVFVFSRTLSVSERTNLMLTTQWRYK